MKNWIKIFGIVVFTILYIISVNIFASFISYSSESQTTKTIMGGSIIEINMGTSLSVQVTRANKWYGRIIENNGISYLHLFGIILLPWEIEEYNFIWFHLIFLVVLSLLIVLIFTKRKIYKEEIPNLEYEKLGEDRIDSY